MSGAGAGMQSAEIRSDLPDWAVTEKEQRRLRR